MKRHKRAGICKINTYPIAKTIADGSKYYITYYLNDVQYTHTFKTNHELIKFLIDAIICVYFSDNLNGKISKFDEFMDELISTWYEFRQFVYIDDIGIQPGNYRLMTFEKLCIYAIDKFYMCVLCSIHFDKKTSNTYSIIKQEFERISDMINFTKNNTEISGKIMELETLMLLFDGYVRAYIGPN